MVYIINNKFLVVAEYEVNEYEARRIFRENYPYEKIETIECAKKGLYELK